MSTSSEGFWNDLGNVGLIVSIVFYSVICVFAPVIHPNCKQMLSPTPTDWNNPSWSGPNPCRFERHLSLLGLNLQECDFGARLVIAALLGAIIGFERRKADRPAGIRTMALASIGASAFTVCSGYGFTHSPMIWDSSRISAAIPSGVGFLGAGIIWKGLVEKKGAGAGGQKYHEVRGLTTAASVWLSAAVGLAAGGRLYAVAIFTTLFTVVILRFGPRLSEMSGQNPSNAASEMSGDDAAAAGGQGPPSRSRVLQYIQKKNQHASLNPYV